MKTVILPCKGCKEHKFQDETYGPKKRVHNVKPLKDKTKPKAVCTICGNEKEV